MQSVHISAQVLHDQHALHFACIIILLLYEILTTSLVAPLDRMYIIMVQGHHECK